MASPPHHRKRASPDRDPTSPLTSNEHSAARDYASISPSTSIRARDADATSPPKVASRKPSNIRRASASAERAAADVERAERGRWRGFWDKYGSVELDNKGSVARDHLALGKLSPAYPFLTLHVFRISPSPTSRRKEQNANR